MAPTMMATLTKRRAYKKAATTATCRVAAEGDTLEEFTNETGRDGIEGIVFWAEGRSLRIYQMWALCCCTSGHLRLFAPFYR